MPPPTQRPSNASLRVRCSLARPTACTCVHHCDCLVWPRVRTPSATAAEPSGHFGHVFGVLIKLDSWVAVSPRTGARVALVRVEDAGVRFRYASRVCS